MARQPKSTEERTGESRAEPAEGTRQAERERIAKRLARAGLCSRRDAEAWIAEGRVAVNGRVIDTPATLVGDSDRIEVDGQPLPARERTRLWLYHKPAGLVTTSRDPEGRPTVFSALPADLPRVLSVGRLDINTEGLLLLTNDGGLARMLELPQTGWLRRYRVRAHGEVDQAALDALKEGIAVDGVLYGPIEAAIDRRQGTNVWITMAFREGKNREVKNVLGALGLTVNRLIRVSYGPFQLGDLEEGAVREIRGRLLRDQLGPRMIEESGADFEAPVHSRKSPDDSVEPASTAGKAERVASRPRRPARPKAGQVAEDNLDRLDTRRGERHAAPGRKPKAGGGLKRAVGRDGDSRRGERGDQAGKPDRSPSRPGRREREKERQTTGTAERIGPSREGDRQEPPRRPRPAGGGDGIGARRREPVADVRPARRDERPARQDRAASAGRQDSSEDRARPGAGQSRNAVSRPAGSGGGGRAGKPGEKEGRPAGRGFGRPAGDREQRGSRPAKPFAGSRPERERGDGEDLGRGRAPRHEGRGGRVFGLEPGMPAPDLKPGGARGGPGGVREGKGGKRDRDAKGAGDDRRGGGGPVRGGGKGRPPGRGGNADRRR